VVEEGHFWGGGKRVEKRGQQLPGGGGGGGHFLDWFTKKGQGKRNRPTV